MIEDFVVFILTHGRADNVRTYETLKRQNYRGPVVFVIDDEDEQMARYFENFGEENVEVFSKTEAARKFDRGDNFDKRGAIIYARNACFDIARKRGFRYFIELDDDDTSFSYRFNENLDFVETRIDNVEEVWRKMLDYFKATPRLSSIAMAQGCDFIGGGRGSFGKLKPARKAMNSFICDTERQFNFVGTINEDVNTYTSKSHVGLLFLSIPLVCLHQIQTQKNAGGMTDLYLDSGTYVKSFYSVMYCPSAVKVAVMGGDAEKRLHHNISWNNCAPKILRENYRKIK